MKDIRWNVSLKLNVESHNLVQNIPNESTNGGLSIQRTISVEIQKYHFPLFIYFDNFFFTISGLPRLVGAGG